MVDFGMINKYLLIKRFSSDEVVSLRFVCPRLGGYLAWI